MDKTTFNEILVSHNQWLAGRGGKQANFSGANFGCADLRGVNLSGANFHNANLRDADLRYVDLRDADLHNADLRYANLSNVDLSGADLSVVDLRGANLRNANLGCTNLNHADLRNADLSRANLSNADLSDAHLCGANLDSTDLSGANLSDVNLRGADLRGVDLSFVPIIKEIDAAILTASNYGKHLNMSDWHQCDTTHCRAGWAITLAGLEGAKLEKRLGPSTAGALIYHVSTGYIPDFHADNEEALEDMKIRAALHRTGVAIKQKEKING